MPITLAEAGMLCMVPIVALCVAVVVAQCMLLLVDEVFNKRGKGK